MKPHGALLVLTAGAMALIPAATGARPGPTPVRYDNGYLPTPKTTSRIWEPCACPAIPEIIGRAGEILGAIDSPQKRSELAEQWLQYSKQVIAKDQEYRQQWLDLQRRQAAQQQQVEELRLEIARLQMQIEALRARNAQVERENLLSQAKLRQTSGNRAAPQPPTAESPHAHPGQALWSSISALLFGAKPTGGRSNHTPE